MKKQGSLGAQLQGVSQQPDHLRSDGEVGEQINMQSDIVRGLTSRPGTVANVPAPLPTTWEQLQELRRKLDLKAAADYNWQNVVLSGDTYQIGTRAGSLVVLDADGRPKEVRVDDPSKVNGYVSANSSAYIGDDMQSFVFDGDVFLTNRGKVVQDQSNNGTYEDKRLSIAARDVWTGEGYVVVEEGFFGHTYIVTVTMSDGKTFRAEYETPESTDPNAGKKSASDYIARQLRNTLNELPTASFYFRCAVYGSVLRIRNARESIPVTSISIRNGAGDSSMRALTGEVERLTDLPPHASHGALVKVVGEPETTDDLYMRWRSSSVTRQGAGFGEAGIWEEWYKQEEPTHFDPNTMPHVLSLDNGVFYLNPIEWEGRQTGDSESNPFPSFYGKAIKDIASFQSRLSFITERTFVASQTRTAARPEAARSFFSSSARVVLDTDPIDMLSTARTSVQLEWIVPFDRDLVIFGKDSQFLITGSVALTPSNASIVQTTDFEMALGAQPVSTGRTVLFPFDSGGFGGVKEFFSANSVDANEAVTLTETLDQYMAGSVSRMIASTNFETVLIQTAGAGSSTDEVFIYKYFWDGEKKAQSSWSKWVFPYPVENMFFDGSLIGVLMRDADGTYRQTYMDLDIPADATTGYPIALDVQLTLTTDPEDTDYVIEGYVDVDYVELGSTEKVETTSVTLPFGNARIVQSTGCAVPGREINSATASDLGNGNWQYSLPIGTAPEGATVICGLAYEQRVEPTKPFVRDRNGRALRRELLTVMEYVAYLEDSGDVVGTVTSQYRSQPISVSNARVGMANDPDDPSGVGLRSGPFVIPCGERADWSSFAIASTDVRPFSITEIEWRGRSQKRGVR